MIDEIVGGSRNRERCPGGSRMMVVPGSRCLIGIRSGTTYPLHHGGSRNHVGTTGNHVGHAKLEAKSR
jgi:hypothetical protein